MPNIARVKRQVSHLQRKLTPLEKQVVKNASTQPAEVDVEHVRCNAKGLRSLRRHLGLSAADCGKLLGVTDQTIYNWEHEVARPRRQQIAPIAALRHTGKREAQARLQELAKGNRKRSK